ncbi:MAG: acyltransferase [Kiritimatiellae bacterium]|nr:acyltransferase [Kiritimatiellia bacterium]
MTAKSERVVFLDWLRLVACLMVMLVHACEAFYFDNDGNFAIQSLADARWVSALDGACRAAVPLFVMASAYLLFPLTRPTGEFFRRRLVRVLAPFAVWCCVYNIVNDGKWGQMLFNFPMSTGGHLWFVPMLLGLYLLMPLLSPWAEKATEKEVRGWLLVWFFTTSFPFLRKLWGHLYGAPDFGAVPFLYGECPWNGFGMFQYVSGFFGYLLLGFYARKFLPALSWRKTLAVALPLWLVGWCIAAGGFYFRIPCEGGYPVVKPYACAVDMEMSWEFCGFGVVCTVIAYFLLVRPLMKSSALHRLVVRPLAEASYGTYLMHMLILTPVVTCLRAHLPMPLTVVATAIATFALASLASLTIRRVPVVGKWICG